MLENKKKLKQIIIIILITVICGVIFIYQTRKQGFHEDEMYTIASSVNPHNGLLTAYKGTGIDFNNNIEPVWKTREYVKDYMTLSSNNYLNLKSLYTNQKSDSHPPFFYFLVHLSSILFSGEFSKYTVFVVNIIAFIFSCIVITRILKLLNKENLSIPILISYGLSMGTISMVIYQRMYMLLTLFILLYFYYTIELYKNNFELNKKLGIKLGIITVLGFLTQYFFAIFAGIIFLIVIIEMIRQKKHKNMARYIGLHIIYAIIGILLFVPCIGHLLYSDRGISNLGNSGYLKHFCTYVKHLLFAFTVEYNLVNIIAIGIFLIVGIVYAIKKSKDRLIIPLLTIPSTLYFLIAVKLTSFQELRYIMPVLPFVVIAVFYILNILMEKFKYKNTTLVVIAIILALNGIIFSSPKFLYEEYEEILEIAKENSDKSFVYVYDNMFNHMQSVPEMMIYNKTIIINANRDELKYVIQNKELETEDSFILSIKAYMDNETILEQIKENTEFKKITQIYVSKKTPEAISNNLYYVSK